MGGTVGLDLGGSPNGCLGPRGACRPRLPVREPRPGRRAVFHRQREQQLLGGLAAQDAIDRDHRGIFIEDRRVSVAIEPNQVRLGNEYAVRQCLDFLGERRG